MRAPTAAVWALELCWERYYLYREVGKNGKTRYFSPSGIRRFKELHDVNSVSIKIQNGFNACTSPTDQEFSIDLDLGSISVKAVFSCILSKRKHFLLIKNMNIAGNSSANFQRTKIE